MKEKKRYKKITITLIILDFLIVLCFFFAYGPVSYFRNLFVTTSMTTMTHKYLAKTIYTESMIEKVLASNYMVESKEETDAASVVVGNASQKAHYDSIYEEQILKRDKNNQDYKIIELSGSTYKGYMVAIYDPSKVSLELAPKIGTTGAFLREIVSESKGKLGINASGFYDPNEYGNGGIPTGTVIKDGKIIYRGGSTGYGGGIAGFNKDNVLILTRSTAEEAIKDGMRDAVEFGPFMVVNGVASNVEGNGGWGIAPRTVLAQRKDGIVLFIIIDGRQPGYSLGISMADMITLLKRYKAQNAVNLDGGASSSLVVGSKTISKPCGYSSTGERRIPNAWVLK